MKCACDDGSLVHPWECCSEGTCNVFCCNCGGPCKKSSPNATEEGEEIGDNRIAKRSVRHILGDSEIAAVRPFACHSALLCSSGEFTQPSTKLFWNLECSIYRAEIKSDPEVW